MHDPRHDDDLHDGGNRRTERKSTDTERGPNQNHVQGEIQRHHPDADFHRGDTVAQCVERARGKLLHGIRPNGWRVHRQHESHLLHIFVTELAALEYRSSKRFAHQHQANACGEANEETQPHAAAQRCHESIRVVRLA